MTAIIDIINDGVIDGYERNENDLLYEGKNKMNKERYTYTTKCWMDFKKKYKEIESTSAAREFTPTTNNNNPIRLSVDRRIYLPCHRKCK